MHATTPHRQGNEHAGALLQLQASDTGVGDVRTMQAVHLLLQARWTRELLLRVVHRLLGQLRRLHQLAFDGAMVAPIPWVRSRFVT